MSPFEEKKTHVMHAQEEMRDFLDSIDYRVARSKTELEAAYALVYKEYLKRGYALANAVGLRFSLHNILPAATTFVAINGNDIVATASVIVDSPLGLPMDDLYKEELDELRGEGKKLCEISMLASDTSLFREGTSLMLNAKKMFLVYYLFKCVFDYVKEQLRVDNICIAINPKHNLTYENLFFKDLGPLKNYDKVNGAPALGKYLDVQSVKEACSPDSNLGVYRLFFQKKTDPKNFENKMMFDVQTIKYFFVDKIPLLQEASLEQIEYIENCYPLDDITALVPVKRS